MVLTTDSTYYTDCSNHCNLVVLSLNPVLNEIGIMSNHKVPI